MAGYRTKQHFVIGLAAAVLVLGACGNSGDEGTVPPLEELGTSTSTNSTPDTTTTTTAPTSTTKTTVVEPAVVESDLAEMERPELEVRTEWDSDLQEIFGRYLLYWEALDIATGPQFADPNYQPLFDLLGPEMAEDIQAHLERIADADAVLVHPEDTLNDHGLRLPNPSVLEKTEGNQVVIQDCWIRDDITDFIDDRPESENFENFETVLWNVDMIVIDGEWRVFAVNEADNRSDGYQECQDLFDTLEK